MQDYCVVPVKVEYNLRVKY